MPPRNRRDAPAEQPAEQPPADEARDEQGDESDGGQTVTLPLVAPDRVGEATLGEHHDLVQEMPYRTSDARTEAGNVGPQAADRAPGEYVRRFLITTKGWTWSDEGDYEKTVVESAQVTSVQDALNAGFRPQAVPVVTIERGEKSVQVVCTMPVIPTPDDDQDSPLAPGALLKAMGGSSVVGSASSGNDNPDPKTPPSTDA